MQQQPSKPTFSEEALANIHTYFTKLAKGQSCTSENWFPKLGKSKNSAIDDKICSPLWGDRRYGDDKTKTVDDEYKALLATVKATVDKSKMKETITKHKLCMIKYVLDELQFNGSRNQTNVGKITYERKLNILVTAGKIDLIVHIINDVSFDVYDAFLENSGFKVDEVYEAGMQKLCADINEEKWSEIPAADIFTINGKPSIIGNEKFTNQDVADELVNYLRGQMKIDNMDDEAFISHLESLDPKNCTSPEINVISLTNFADFKLSELHQIIHVAWKRCFTAEYLLENIFSSYDKLELNGFDINSNENKTIKDNFENNVIPRLAEFATLKKEHYYDRAVEMMRSWPDGVGKGIQEKEKRESNFDYFAFFKHFITYLYTQHTIDLNNTVATSIIKRAGPTLFNLLALLGFTLLSDDVSVHNGTENTFHISTYCIGQFNSLITSLNDEFAGLGNEFLTLRGGKGALYEILDKIHESCIHANGGRLLSLYCDIYNRVAGNLIDLAPVLLPVPPELLAASFASSSERKLKFVSCVRYDDFQFNKLIMAQPPSIYAPRAAPFKTVTNCNPLNAEYLVLGVFVDNGGGVSAQWLCRISGTHMHPTHNIRTPVDFLERNPAAAVKITPYEETLVCQDVARFLLVAHNWTHLVKLMRIPHLFQKDRKLTFTMYKEYALHWCRLNNDLTQSPSNTLQKVYTIYNEWKTPKDVFNVIEVEDKTLDAASATDHKAKDQYARHFFARLITGNKTATKLETLHMLNSNAKRANTSKSEWEYDLISNIVDLEYNKDKDNDKLVVKHPLYTYDITRSYQYLSILNKMFNPQKYFANVYICTSESTLRELKATLRQFDAFTKLCGQDSVISTMIYNNIYTDVTHENLQQGIKKVIKSNNANTAHIRDKTKYNMALLKDLQFLDMYNVDKVLKVLSATPKTEYLLPTVVGDSVQDVEVTGEDLGGHILKLMGYHIFVCILIVHEYSMMGAGAFDKRAYANLLSMVLTFTSLPRNEAEVDEIMHTYYTAIVDILVGFINVGGHDATTFEYHFTELARDFELLKSIGTVVKTFNVNVLDNTPRGHRGRANDEIKQTWDAFAARCNDLHYPYKDDDGEYNLKLEDHQDGFPTVFELITKAALVDELVGRFTPLVLMHTHLKQKAEKTFHKHILDTIATLQRIVPYGLVNYTEFSDFCVQYMFS